MSTSEAARCQEPLPRGVSRAVALLFRLCEAGELTHVVVTKALQLGG